MVKKAKASAKKSAIVKVPGQRGASKAPKGSISMIPSGVTEKLVGAASGLTRQTKAKIAKNLSRASGRPVIRSSVSRIKKRIKSALYRQARYQVATGQPMRAAKTLRKRFRVV